MPELYERVRVETLVINTGANGRCDECGHLHNLYRKRGEGSRRLCAYCISAGALRRAELDSELQAMGATTIEVEDLEAAMEAYEAGFAGGECIRAAFIVSEGMAYYAGRSNASLALGVRS